MIYVLDKSGKPLMPTTRNGKVKRLRKAGYAKVVCYSPYTIQLLYEPKSKEVQETTLGIDPGYEHVGASVVTDKRELFRGDFKLRTDIQKRLAKRRMYRRSRRNRLRYRKPRFLNRKRQYKDTPSVRHKVESHIRVINRITKILPISKVRLEVNKFDIAKINNPDIQGAEYQQGVQVGHKNVKEYVKWRDNYKCHFHSKDCKKVLHVHHIDERINAGSNAPSNQITLCELHHGQLHAGKIELPKCIKGKRQKAATFMNVVIARLKELLPDVEYTYGYITKAIRQYYDLEKSHTNDAFVIAGGNTHFRAEETKYIFKRKNSRALGKQRKGFAPCSRKQRYPIQPRDIISYEGKLHKAIGTHIKGRAICFTLDGKRVSRSAKAVKLVYYQRTLQTLVG